VFLNILVAVDGSPASDRALQEAIDLARASNARLTVMTVVPDLPGPALGPAGAAGFDLTPMIRETEREYTAVLRAAVERVPAEIHASEVLAHGRPASSIVKQVKEGHHDLVVMGSRGRGDVRSLLLGSESHAVLNTCRVAVLIVHAETRPD